MDRDPQPIIARITLAAGAAPKRAHDSIAQAIVALYGEHHDAPMIHAEVERLFRALPGTTEQEAFENARAIFWKVRQIREPELRQASLTEIAIKAAPLWLAAAAAAGAAYRYFG